VRWAEPRTPRMGQAELEDQIEQSHAAAFGWALSCCERRREEAQDVLQTVYFKILDGRAAYSGNSSFRTWLFSLIRITALDRRRSWFRRMARDGAVPLRLASADRESELIAAERSRAVEDALRLLSERQREVLHLAFYQEMTIEDAAEVMGVALGTARSHYERGKARLRELLADELGERT